MKTQLALIFLTIVENYFSSAIDEPQWVKDMLNIESSNGIQSLKAPIISPKKSEEMKESSWEGGAMGRSLQDGIANIPDNNEGDISAMASRQATDIQDDVPEGIDSTPQSSPNNEQPEPGRSNTGQGALDGNSQEYPTDTEYPKVGNGSIASQINGNNQDQPSRFRIPAPKKIIYHKPAPVSPLVQIQKTNMLLKRDHHKQIVLNAYKRLAEVNQKKAFVFHGDS